MYKLFWKQLIYIAKKMKFPFYLDVVDIAKFKIKNNETNINTIMKTNNVEIEFVNIYSGTKGDLFILSIVSCQCDYSLAISLYDDGSYDVNHYQDYPVNVHGLFIKKNYRRKYYWKGEVLI